MDAMTSFQGREGHVGDPVRIGIVTVSDRASRGEYEDEAGPASSNFVQEPINSPWPVSYRSAPDEQEAVEAALIELTGEQECSVVVTTGGTGPAPRDITPEATEAVCDRLMPGFGEQMRAISLTYVPTAILSRQLGGLRSNRLIFNLPGRPKSIRETIDEIWRAVPYCVDLMNGPYMDMDAKVCDAFRPPSARR